MTTSAEVIFTGAAITYTPDDGLPVTFSLTPTTIVFPYKRRRNADQFDFTKQDAWGNPAPPATGLPDLLPATGNTVWFVRVMREQDEFLDIPMGSITNQGTWTNDETGAVAAHDAIVAALPA